MTETNNAYDIVILGAGIAGLNSAYRLSKQNTQWKILVLEKDREHLGGRILTYKDATMTVDAGAARFHKNQEHIHKLLKELGFTEKDMADIPPSDYYYDIKTKSSITNPSDKITQKLIEETKKPDKKTNQLVSREQLQNQNILDYAKTVLVEAEIQLLVDSFGYYTELTEMNAHDFIQLFENHLSKAHKFQMLKGGMYRIIQKLEENLSAQSNVTILKNHTVISIQKSNPFYEIGCKSRKITYTGARIIVALPKQVVAQIAYFKEIKNVLKKSIHCGNLCRIYSKFPKNNNGNMWFAGLSKFTTNNHIRMVVPISEKTGVIMISYSDHHYATYWKNIYKTSGTEVLETELIREIKEATGIEDIPMPENTKMFYWDCGVGYWKVGANSSQLSKQFIQPIQNESVYLCGEHYSEKNQEWMEGALETSDYIVSHYFK